MPELYRLDILGTWAFRALAFRVGHLLAYLQFVETDALEARFVEEQGFFAPRVDESEAFLRHVFDNVFFHLCFPRIDCSN